MAPTTGCCPPSTSRTISCAFRACSLGMLPSHGLLAGTPAAIGRVVSISMSLAPPFSTPYIGRESRDILAPQSYLLLLEIPATKNETGVQGVGSGRGLKRLDSGKHGSDQVLVYALAFLRPAIGMKSRKFNGSTTAGMVGRVQARQRLVSEVSCLYHQTRCIRQRENDQLQR